MHLKQNRLVVIWRDV